MMRLLLVTGLVMLAAGRAQAQTTTPTPTGTLPNGGTITFNELKIHEDNNPDLVFPKITPDSLWHYFNYAHCQCGGEPDITPPATFHEGTFAFLIEDQGTNAPVSPSRALQLWAGPDCSNVSLTGEPPTDCTLVGNVDSVNDLINNNTRPPIGLFDFMTPTATTAMTCPTTLQGTSTLWAAVDTDGDGHLDYFVSMTVNTDSDPPPPPTGFEAQGGDGAIVLSWKPPADVSDVYAYQALCARADTMAPGKTSGRPGRRYLTAQILCGATTAASTIALMPADVAVSPEVTESPVTTVPPGLASLDSTFLCGETLTPTDTGLRIDGLENGVPYVVAVLTEDKFQNAIGTYFTTTVTPEPSTDFWEDLHDRGSKADGGLCLIAETYGDDNPLTNALRSFRDDTLGRSSAGRWLGRAYYATLGKLGASVHGSLALRVASAILLMPLVALALLWHWLSLPVLVGLLSAGWLGRRHRAAIARWCRRLVGRRAAQVAAGLAVAVVAIAPAHADGSGYQPYWEDNQADHWNDQTPEEGPGISHWHVGVRVGPYTPDIDKQLGQNPGPYAQMFGGARYMPMLDVDRFLWTGFGQLGVGLSVGYMQKFAHTFRVDPSSQATVYTERAADTNTFRLLPTELSAVYRLTYLDDEYGVPIVPYARAGIAYYIWSLTGSDGSFAKVCQGSGMEPSCSQNKAFGASLGVQGAIGLSIRAERIDAAAASSMRQSGIQHAGIFGELSIASVDGFGSDTKLSVGDRTWFAGVDFEF